MISTYDKLLIPDENKTNDLVLEVNWSKDPKIANCNVIKVILPDGKESYIKKAHFLAALFAFGTADEQRDMIPKKIEIIRKYKTLLGITATKDIKKGEKINVQVDIPLPPIEKEIIEASKRTNKISTA